MAGDRIPLAWDGYSSLESCQVIRSLRFPVAAAISDRPPSALVGDNGGCLFGAGGLCGAVRRTRVARISARRFGGTAGLHDFIYGDDGRLRGVFFPPSAAHPLSGVEGKPQTHGGTKKESQRTGIVLNLKHLALTDAYGI